FALEQRCKVVPQNRNDSVLGLHAESLEARIGLHFAQAVYAVVGMNLHDDVIEPAEGSTAFDQGVLDGQVQRNDFGFLDFHSGSILCWRRPDLRSRRRIELDVEMECLASGSDYTHSLTKSPSGGGAPKESLSLPRPAQRLPRQSAVPATLGELVNA